MLRIFCVFYLLTLSFVGFSQRGDFPIKNHSPAIPGIDNTTYDMIFDQNGLMYIANRSGVLRYDGARWEYIKTPAAAISLALDLQSNTIYVGCHGSFGYLKMTKNGVEYVQVNQDSISDSFFSTQIVGDSICYLNSNQLYIYHPKTEQINTYPSPDKHDLTALIVVDQSIYVNTETASYEWKGDKMKISYDWIADSYPPQKLTKSAKGNYVMMDLTGKVFLKKSNGQFVYLEGTEDEANDFEWVSDSLFVVSTRDLGCLFYNGLNGQLMDRIDYESGLPDNEILKLETDWAMGVWVAHQFGFSRIDPTAPVQCLSNYEGIEGNLLSTAHYKGQTLVGTSSGLFRLISDSVFSINVSTNKAKVNLVESSSSSRGLFKKQTTSSPKYGSKTKTIEDKRFEYARWKFERMPEVISKCNTMITHKDILLIGTNLGLFEYNGSTLSKILNRSVKEIIPVKDSNEFFVVGGDQNAERYLRENGEYTALTFGYDQSRIISMFGDSRGLIWLITPEKLILSGLTYYGLSVLKDLEFNDKYFDKPTIIEINDQLYFVTKEGFFLYNYDNNTLTADSSLLNKLGAPLNHKADPSGAFWMFDGKVWKLVDQNGSFTTYPYLSLFPELRFIRKGTHGEVFFIDQQNQFYRYLPKMDRKEIYQSNIFYKHVFAQSQYNTFKDQFDLTYDQNYLSAEVSQPDYLGLLKVEFQHRVEGIDNEWSLWSPNNRVDLDHLPDGKYVLQVRSKDIFGRIQSMEPITLVVSPPYWQTTWFYLLEVFFFASMVVISARLNQKKAQNRWLTEGLTILTIIMIIESLQSIAGSYFTFASSPILDFGVNLIIALIIFPLEQQLRKWIKNGKIDIQLKSKDKEAKVVNDVS